MNRKWLGCCIAAKWNAARWIGIFVLAGAGVGLLSLSSCARPTQLISISITPSTGGTFGGVDPALYFQFKAIGTYIHPPKTVDITDQVDWQSDNPQVITITSTGVASPNQDCGVAQVFAEMHQDGNDIVSNQDSITVNGPAAEGCTPAGPQPTLTTSLTGSGTVVSNPPGIDCQSSSSTSCNSTFIIGTSVTLTGTPTGTSTLVSWTGCSSSSGTQCIVVMENSITVTAAFQ